MVRCPLFLIYASVLCSVVAETPLWNQFRGPNGSGVAEHCKPPVAPSRSNRAWSVAVPPGHSSPVLSAERLFLTAVDQEELVTIALDKASGELIWRAKCPPAKREKVHATSSPAASTPTVDGDFLYVYFGSFGLLCYDFEGSTRWSKAIPTPRSLYGMSTCPIIHKDLVILVLDDENNLPDSKLKRSKMIALSKHTGALVWETARPFHRSGWSTPMIWTHDQGQDLVVLGHQRLNGYDPDTGVEKWHVNGFSRETIAIPVAGNGYLFASAAMLGGVSDDQPDVEPFWRSLLPFDTNRDSKLERSEMKGHFTFPLRPNLPLGHPGFGIPMPKDDAGIKRRYDGMMRSWDKDKDGFVTREEFLSNMTFNRGKPNLMAIRPGGQGELGESHVAWRLHKNIPEVPSPLFHDNRLYLVRDGGVMSAIDATNGKTLYRKRLGATGQYSPSPILANEHVYVFSGQGVLTVISAGDDFEIVHQYDFAETIAGTPAMDDNTLYVRTAKELVAFRDQLN